MEAEADVEEPETDEKVEEAACVGGSWYFDSVSWKSAIVASMLLYASICCCEENDDDVDSVDGGSKAPFTDDLA